MNTNKLNHKNFKERAVAAHGLKYDYSFVSYKGASKRVKISCPKHGFFEQSPSKHVSGKGCPFCERNQLTRDEFIKQASSLHQNKYEYSKCTYTHNCSKSKPVTITCKNHGDFLRTPDAHVKGKGCPSCEKEARKNIKGTGTAVELQPYTFELPVETYNGFVVTMRFKPLNADTDIHVRSEFFNRLEAAESFIESMKMYVELTDALLVEAIISERLYEYGSNQKQSFNRINVEAA